MSEVMVPEGFRFVPTEEELISSYLLKKAMGLPLPSKHILERDLYGDNASPWDVLSDVSEAYWDIHVPLVNNNHDDEKELKKVKKSIYVFTRWKRANGRISRIAGCGTWKGQTVARKIRKGSNGEEIGVMKMFTFIPKNNKEAVGSVKDHWNMHEYSLSEVSLSCDQVKNNKDYVICRITRELILKKERQPRINPAPCLDNVVRYPNENNQLYMLQEEENTTHVQTEDDVLDNCYFDIDELLSTLQESDQQERQPISSTCLDLVRYSDNNQLTLQEENTELLGTKKRSFEKEEDEILSCNKKQKNSSSFEELGNNNVDHIVAWEELGDIVELSSHNNYFNNISVDDYEYGDGYFCDFDQLEDGVIGNSNNIHGFLMPKQTTGDDENPIILD